MQEKNASKFNSLINNSIKILHLNQHRQKNALSTQGIFGQQAVF
jgi:hypothetical protein